MQEADRHGLDAVGLEIIQDRRKSAHIKRFALDPLVGHASRQFTAQVTRHERLWLAVMQVEEIRAVAARDLQRVAEAFGGDQPDLDALALGQRIDDDRRAVGEEVDGRRIDAAFFENVEYPLLEIGRRGVGLCSPDRRLAGGQVGFKTDQIGEGAADIGCNADGLVPHYRSLLDEMDLLSRKVATPGSLRASEAATRSGV